MSITPSLPAVERPRFFDGERLTAADLLDAQAYERELRWTHNRYLHPWGIAVGLTVSAARGDKIVTVGAGYALDCQGRDLVVAVPATLQVPPVAGADSGGPATFLLTVSYVDDDDLPADTRAGACGTSGAVRLPERALVRWQTDTDTNLDTRYRPGLDVVLATAAVKGCKLDAAPSTGARQDAAVAAPYVATGRTEAGGTRWSLWPDESAAHGFVTTVSTADAGFAGTPRYQAELIGKRIFPPASGGGDAIVEGFVHLENAGPASFDLCVALPQGQSAGGLNPAEVFLPSFLGRLANELEWHVTWIGVEG
jgi:hypothetical protein